MTIALPLEELGAARSSRERDAASLAVSVLFHASLVAVATLSITRSLPAPPLQSIAVEIVSSVSYRAMTAPPAPAPQAPTPAPQPLAASPQPVVPADTAQPATAPGPIVATNLRAANVLADPSNRRVRDTLPTLAPMERLIQLCDIEAVEQIRLAKPGSHPETIAAATFDDPVIHNGVLVANGAAYRSDHGWYRLSFSCEPRDDLLAVTAFSLTLGDAVPREDREDHNLIAEDEDDDDD